MQLLSLNLPYLLLFKLSKLHQPSHRSLPGALGVFSSFR
ncbi:unnamed protein product [Amoebophrya sp. A120]|nr:unnamed protein product [Amoebophrya sp. A120]|eukprot:GSA120T00009469001.1